MSGGATRRELFRLAGGLLAGAALTPGAGLAAGEGAALDASAAAALARGWLRDPRAARALGAGYLAAHPEERDAERLRAGCLGEGSAVGAAGRFAERRRRDFERGDTLTLSGWVVSRSEARLCALLALA